MGIREPKTGPEALNSFVVLSEKISPDGDPLYFEINPEIHSQKELEGIQQGKRYGYMRHGKHPHETALAEQFAEIYGGKDFVLVRPRSEGMNAVSMALYAVLESRAMEHRSNKVHAIAILSTYGATTKIFQTLHHNPLYNAEVTILYAKNLTADLLYQTIRPNTAAIFFEIETNPTLVTLDVEMITRTARLAPIPPVVICDLTFFFGLFKPFRWGIDITVDSSTKYPTGLSAYMMGDIAVTKATLERYPALWKQAWDWSTRTGGTLGPFEAWFTSKFTIADAQKRVMRQSENALAFARYFEKHPLVERVLYPGLDSYPWRENAEKYLEVIDGRKFYGGMAACYVKTKRLEETLKLLFHLNQNSHIKHRASLGCRVSMVESPAALSHFELPPDLKRDLDITDNLVRISIGLENPEDTIAAFERSLYAILG